jgi:hypothetical protein
MSRTGARLAGIGVLALTIALTAGCLSIGGTPLSAVDVYVSEGNQILHNGKPIQMEKLAGRLKSLGAAQTTRIQVHLAVDTSPATVEAIRQTLVLNGLPRLVLISATRTAGAAGSPSRTPPPPSPTK